MRYVLGSSPDLRKSIPKNFILVNVGQPGAFMEMIYFVLVYRLHVNKLIHRRKIETGVFSGMI